MPRVEYVQVDRPPRGHDDAVVQALAAAIRRSIREAGYSSERAFAAEHGFSQSEIQRWAAGKRLPQIDTLFNLDRALGRPSGYLLRAAGLVEDTTSTEDAIKNDPRLVPDVQGVVLDAFEGAVRRSAVMRDVPADRASATTPRSSKS